ncbi:MAG: hypothetical protein ACLQNE_40550 [Thermoguttaceae bacterium]
MRWRVAGFLAVVGGWFAQPAPALAGMPSVVLNDWAALRIETISFFLGVLLGSAALVRWLWNYLVADFPRLPRLIYRRTLAAVVLWGVLLAVVLTMIAGSRELLTPGAWQKEGLLYKVAGPAESGPSMDEGKDHLDQRRQHLAALQKALWAYAATHDGKFPSRSDPAMEASLWEMPGAGGMTYLYVSGKNADNPADPLEPLACEPEIYNANRLVLTTGGEIVPMTSAELRSKLRPEKSP